MRFLPPVALFVTMLSSTIGAGTEADAIARGAPSEAPHPEVSRPLTVHESYGRLPLSFERNQGQTGQDVKFLSRGRGYTLFLTGSETVLALQSPGARPAIVRMSLAGASREVRIDGLDERPGTVNYFKGRDSDQWHRGIPTYARVRYAGVYPGVDLIFYSSAGKLQYDFIVAPGANPEVIRLLFDGARLAIDAGGDLLLRVEDGEVRMGKPLVYQNLDGRRVSVPGSWVLTAADEAGFELAPYDSANTLIIDPILSYSTYLGGSFDDFAREIAVDAAGHAYVTGVTNSIDFPVTAGAVQPSPLEPGGHHDAFVAKLEPDGSGLVYATYLGGFAPEVGWGITVDAAGNAYVTGETLSSDFPVTPGAFQNRSHGAFVAKIDATGSTLVYSAVIGGSLSVIGRAVAVDTAGRAYVTGETNSPDFPVTPGAFQSVLHGVVGESDAFVMKLETDGSALVYATYLGSGGGDVGRGIAVDGEGHAYVVGETRGGSFPRTAGAFQTLPRGSRDAFVTKLTRDGSALVYSTLLGSSGSEFGTTIAVDSLGHAYVAGQTSIPPDVPADFPVTPGAFQTHYGGNSDAFVTKLDPTGSSLVYSTYLGGGHLDLILGIALDADRHAYVAGWTFSDDFPTVGAFQSTRRGEYDSFVAKLDASGSTLLYSTYLGGTGNDLAQGIGVDAAGAAYVAGITLSSDFPTTPGVLQPTFADGVRDAFVSKITDDVAPPPPGTNTTGKVTGGGTVPVGDHFGTFSLAVERRRPSDAVRGNLQYINRATGARLRAVTFSSFSIARSTVTFGGTCTRDGAPCTFVATVIDEGEPGTSDRFMIAVSSAPAEGGVLRSGNIRIH
jgi:hypothetical protein